MLEQVKEIMNKFVVENNQQVISAETFMLIDKWKNELLKLIGHIYFSGMFLLIV